jgi:hypothetical protein
MIAFAASCEENKSSPASQESTPPADLGAVKITLVPQQGKNVDIVIRWIPILESDDWVPATATLINSALVACGTPGASVDVRFWVRANTVNAPPDSVAKTEETKCVYRFLEGKSLSASGMGDEHEVLVRIAPPSIER